LSVGLKADPRDFGRKLDRLALLFALHNELPIYSEILRFSSKGDALRARVGVRTCSLQNSKELSALAIANTGNTLQPDIATVPTGAVAAAWMKY
jgi:hypothetical protein